MNAYVRAGREVGLVLIPEFRRLIADVPRVLVGARREVALLRAAALFVGAGADDDAGERLGVAIELVGVRGVVEAIARPFAAQRAASAPRSSAASST